MLPTHSSKGRHSLAGGAICNLLMCCFLVLNLLVSYSAWSATATLAEEMQKLRESQRSSAEWAERAQQAAQRVESKVDSMQADRGHGVEGVTRAVESVKQSISQQGRSQRDASDDAQKQTRDALEAAQAHLDTRLQVKIVRV